MFFDYLIIIIYLAILLLTGILSAEKISSLHDFSLSDKKYGVFALTATLSASFIGGGFSSGNAAANAMHGIGNTVALFGFSLSVILVAVFIVPKIHKFKDCLSVGEIMGKTYGSFARIITGIFSFMVCAGICGAQVSAMGYMFHVLLGTSYTAGVIIGCSVAVLYSTFGGMKAVVMADIIQFIILITGIPLLLFFSLSKTGGIINVAGSLPKEYFNIFGNSSPIAFSSAFLSFALGEALVPPFVQRLLIGQNTSVTKKAALISGVLSVFFFIITGMCGLCGAVYFAGKAYNAESVMQLMIINTVPLGFRGIITATMLSVLMSSADSFLNSASVTLSNDVLSPLFCIKSKAARLITVYIVSLLTGLFAMLTAIKIPAVLDALNFAYSFYTPVILVPLVAAFLNIKKPKYVFYVSLFSGLIFMTLWNGVLHAPFGINGAIIGTAANLTTFILFGQNKRRL